MAGGDEATQVDEFLDESLDDEREGEDEDSAGLLWGRLVSHAGADPVELRAEEDGARRAEVVLGRNDMLCDVVVNCDRRVSQRHCRIAYEPVKGSWAGPVPAQVFLENLSGNGTWVNTHVKLAKGEKRRLNSGDEFSLLCPTAKKIAGPTLERATFTFVALNSNAGSVKQASSAAAMVSAEDDGIMGSELRQSVTTALEAGRNVLAHYDLREELGRGQFGVVYRAIERQSGTHWACKQVDVRKLVMNGESSIKDLVNEVRVLKDLKHPHIIECRDVFRDDASLCIIMEIAEGGDLFDRIVTKHPKGYPVPLARQLMTQVLSAVEFLHSRDIAHRDLKPENILLSSVHSDVDVKLTDFGLAKRDAGACKTFCGTPQYFAPEVLRRQDTVSHTTYGFAADIWSVGVITYVTLSGSPPFKSSDLDGQVRTASFKPMVGPRWEKVPNEAKDLVNQVLVVDPHARPTARGCLDHPWLKEVAQDSTAAAPTAAVAAAGAAAPPAPSTVEPAAPLPPASKLRPPSPLPPPPRKKRARSDPTPAAEAAGAPGRETETAAPPQSLTSEPARKARCTSACSDGDRNGAADAHAAEEFPGASSPSACASSEMIDTP